MATRLMLVDDHAIVREGLKQLLEFDGEMQVVAEASNGIQCLDIIKSTIPDVMLLDINMDKMNGLEVLEEMRKKQINIPTIILTVHTEVDYLVRSVELGVNGYLMKDSDFETIKKAIHEVLAGNVYIEKSLLPYLDQAAIDYNKDKELIEKLTNRELCVLKSLSLARTNKEIGDDLDISERTVKNHLFSIFKKLEVVDRTQAAIFAIRNNMVDIYGNRGSK